MGAVAADVSRGRGNQTCDSIVSAIWKRTSRIARADGRYEATRRTSGGDDSPQTMKKIDLGQAISIVANIGVIAGIVFLAYELRQNTQAMRLNAVQFQASEEAEFNRYWTDPDIARIRVALETDGYESLTPEQKVQIYGVVQSFLRVQQSLFYQVQQGGLDPAYWSGRERQLVQLFKRPEIIAAWNQESYAYDDAFRDYIQRVVIQQD